MAPEPSAKHSRMKAREHGAHPIQMRVPDTRSADFRAEAQSQSAAIAASAQAREDQAFIDAAADSGDA